MGIYLKHNKTADMAIAKNDIRIRLQSIQEIFSYS